MDIKITKFSSFNYLAVYTNDVFIVTGVGGTIAEAITDALLQYNKTTDKLGSK